MRRREFIKVLRGAAAAWPLAARAQQESVPVVGVLSGQSQDSEAALLAEWRKALNDTGYVGGRNVLFEYRFADGQGDRLPMLAADLVEVPNRQDKSRETAKKFGVERKQLLAPTTLFTFMKRRMMRRWLSL